MLLRGLSITGQQNNSNNGLAQGRLPERQPLAVIDIGSNSVRQVVYEGLTRAPSILFNEKILCGLGKGVAMTGKLDDEAASRAISAVTRFHQIGEQMSVKTSHVLATAAVREAKNGAEFLKTIEKICGSPVQLLSGNMEAYYAGLGISSGFFEPDGIVGDLGGGSMELIPTNGGESDGVTTPLGSLRLQQDSDDKISEARKIAEKAFSDVKLKWPGKSRTFYAIGGTWRSLAKLHMLENDYPSDVLHGYTIKASDYIKFCNQVAKQDLEKFKGIDSISKNRMGLLSYAALVMAETLEHLGAKEVATSAIGLREGFLYSLLDQETQKRDALLDATSELAILRARSPQHSLELADWTGRAFEVFEVSENKHEKRWRKAACNLADIVWRSSFDFRAEQTLGIINNAGFTSISHEGRAFLSIANFHRYQGLGSKKIPPSIANLASDETLKRARLLAALFRVSYLFSASVEGILPRLKFEKKNKELHLNIPSDLASLVGERPLTRLSQLGREIGQEITILTE